MFLTSEYSIIERSLKMPLQLGHNFHTIWIFLLILKCSLSLMETYFAAFSLVGLGAGHDSSHTWETLQSLGCVQVSDYFTFCEDPMDWCVTVIDWPLLGSLFLRPFLGMLCFRSQKDIRNLDSSFPDFGIQWCFEFLISYKIWANFRKYKEFVGKILGGSHSFK